MISVSIGNDAFTSAILSALIEIPSYIFLMLFVDNFGRKPILVFTLFLMGITCIPAGYASGPLQTALSLAGKILPCVVGVCCCCCCCMNGKRVIMFFMEEGSRSTINIKGRIILDFFTI